MRPSHRKHLHPKDSPLTHPPPACVLCSPTDTSLPPHQTKRQQQNRATTTGGASGSLLGKTLQQSQQHPKTITPRLKKIRWKKNKQNKQTSEQENENAQTCTHAHITLQNRTDSLEGLRQKQNLQPPNTPPPLLRPFFTSKRGG